MSPAAPCSLLAVVTGFLLYGQVGVWGLLAVPAVLGLGFFKMVVWPFFREKISRE